MSLFPVGFALLSHNSNKWDVKKHKVWHIQLYSPVHSSWAAVKSSNTFGSGMKMTLSQTRNEDVSVIIQILAHVHSIFILKFSDAHVCCLSFISGCVADSFAVQKSQYSSRDLQVCLRSYPRSSYSSTLKKVEVIHRHEIHLQQEG